MTDKWCRKTAKRKHDGEEFKFSALGLELLNLFAAGESVICFK